ncbi:DegT/DnrJ/EryC1/StrS family aminotransferase [Pseudomonadales bacterium]|nr:DegT/DnrJ/EryC1/StrS family aminotransferase [Pseudomonadales bacterium]
MIKYENLRAVNAPFFDDLQRSFSDTLESGWYVLGDNVKTFERCFSEYIGVDECVGVANGLDALLLALKALNLRPGDEVIVPSNTYIATILAVVQAGLTPVLVEPSLKTYNIDPLEIEKSITSKTRAILVVHLYGKACEMDAILSLCKQHDLRLIEDCAQSHGATYKGKKTGSFGDFGCFSFYPTKNLGALGDAGAVVCNDKMLSDKVRQLRNYGSSIKYYNEVLGYNSRLDEVQAGFLNIKLQFLDDITRHKRALADIYRARLSDNFIKPEVCVDFFDVYHIFNIRHTERDLLRDYLLDNHIQTEIHYPVSPNRQKALTGYFRDIFPISELIHATTLSLPISFSTTEDEVIQVCEVMNAFE